MIASHFGNDDCDLCECLLGPIFGIGLQKEFSGVCEIMCNVDMQPVDLSKKLFLAQGVICGMEYLHSIKPHPVIHGDLKTQNVLVGDGLIAKVCVNQILA